MKSVLLLNPPGKKLYLRDYYCSKVSQAEYINPPLDLLLLSGILGERYSVDMIDAIVERLTIHDVLSKIAGSDYVAVVVLVGSVSWEEDRVTIKKIKEHTGALIIATGDLLLENGTARMEEVPEIDAVLLDFTSSDILNYLEQQYDTLTTILYRHGSKILSCPVKREKKNFFEIPVPKHELFVEKGYRHPFARSNAFSAVLTDFGCPFRCTFCIMATLGYKYRSEDSVLDEVQHLTALGIKDVFWADQTFGVIKDRNKNICQRMIDDKIQLNWFTFSRVDVVDRDMLELMKRAGCHTVIFGVESASEELLKKYRKGYTKRQIEQAFDWCDQLGIDTVATYILGLPEETEETCRETINFAKKLPCDFASFNVAVPRAGTTLRDDAVQSGLVEDSCTIMDQSGTAVAMPTKHLSVQAVKMMKRRAVFGFYFRLSYIFRRLRKIKSLSQFILQVKSAAALIKNFI